MCVCADTCVCSMWCTEMQQEKHEVCLDGLNVCNMGKVCETQRQRPKHGKHDLIRQKPIIGTHLSPIQHKNVTWTLWQTPIMQQSSQVMKNAWAKWNMPQYMLKLPQEASTDTQTANGTQPNQEFGKIFTKNKNPNPFLKNPQFW